MLGECKICQTEASGVISCLFSLFIPKPPTCETLKIDWQPLLNYDYFHRFLHPYTRNILYSVFTTPLFHSTPLLCGPLLGFVTPWFIWMRLLPNRFLFVTPILAQLQFRNGSIHDNSKRGRRNRLENDMQFPHCWQWTSGRFQCLSGGV